MADTLRNRFANAVNAFREGEDNRLKNTRLSDTEVNGGYGSRTSSRIRAGGERTTLASIYTRISLDCAMVDFRHARVGQNDEFLEIIPSNLHDCLTVSSNLDQTALAFKMDLLFTILQEGHAVVVPVDTTLSPSLGSYDILSLRVGRVVHWYASHVRVDLYDQRSGKHQEVTLDKNDVALIENPFYEVMNEPNSTLKRLQRKIFLMDSLDENLGSGKLDLIIGLPYVVKSQARKEQAEQRRKDMEMQLTGSKYGIAYTDGTEKITQLNRPAENNLQNQIEYLEGKLYSEIGLTQEIMDGTADEKAMLNYYNRTTAPILEAITQEFTRKFLSKTARTQRQVIKAMRDPFELVPLANLAELIDKFTRNEVATSNEMRGVIGWYPSTDPKADELRNSNLSQPAQADGAVAPDNGSTVLPPGSSTMTEKERKAVLKSLLYGNEIDLNPENSGSEDDQEGS